MNRFVLTLAQALFCYSADRRLRFQKLVNDLTIEFLPPKP
jgi:hypothetical protein